MFQALKQLVHKNPKPKFYPSEISKHLAISDSNILFELFNHFNLTTSYFLKNGKSTKISLVFNPDNQPIHFVCDFDPDEAIFQYTHNDITFSENELFDFLFWKLHEKDQLLFLDQFYSDKPMLFSDIGQELTLMVIQNTNECMFNFLVSHFSCSNVALLHQNKHFLKFSLEMGAPFTQNYMVEIHPNGFSKFDRTATLSNQTNFNTDLVPPTFFQEVDRNLHTTFPNIHFDFFSQTPYTDFFQRLSKWIINQYKDSEEYQLSIIFDADRLIPENFFLV